MFEFMRYFIQSQGHLIIQPNYFMTSLGQKFIYASICTSTILCQWTFILESLIFKVDQKQSHLLLFLHPVLSRSLQVDSSFLFSQVLSGYARLCFWLSLLLGVGGCHWWPETKLAVISGQPHKKTLAVPQFLA